MTFAIQVGSSFASNTFGISGGAVLSGTNAIAYATMLDGGWYRVDEPMSFDLTGLTINQQYLIQVWTADFRGFAIARTSTFVTAGAGNSDVNSPTLSFLSGTDGNPGTGTGQFAIGRFTADSTSLTFTLTGNVSQLNALQLRAIPEPRATGLLLLGGLGVFILMRHRRTV